MSIAFVESQTKLNLMRAFAGESQARNRYTFAASVAKKENLPIIADTFLFTAGQEKEHAEIFYHYLREFAGGNIGVNGDYPIDDDSSAAILLRASQKNEFEEADSVYPSFAMQAEEEGFKEIAQRFRMIAQIEKTHGTRFSYFASLIERQQLFAYESSGKWMCLNCGHIHEGKSAPTICPVCQHAQGYFIRLSDAPYSSATNLG